MYKTLAILGGGLEKDNGKWRTTNYTDLGDKFGLSGDRMRLEAARCLYEDEKVGSIIILGGKGQLHAEPDLRSVSYVMSRELVKMGVPEQKMTLEKKSGSTFEQLAELSKLLDEEDYEVPLISNEFHLPRISAMIDHLLEREQFKKLERVVPMSAEMIVLKYESSKWKALIDKAYSSDAMKERIQREEKGIEDLKTGKYKFNHYE